MKKILLLVLISTIINTVAFGQWTTQNSGTTEGLNEVKFLSSSVGYAVGNNGTMVKTTDGGLNWNNVVTGTSEDLISLFFVNDNKGFIGGKYGVFLKTENGGQTWQNGNISAITIEDIYFIDDSIGFVSIWSTILRTSDGGDSWDTVNIVGGTNHKIREIHFPSDQIGYAASNGILKTTDGGLNWIKVKGDFSSDYSGADFLRQVFMTSDTTGFFGGQYYSSFYSTKDGCNTVVKESSDVIYDIYFSTSQTGYVISLGDTSVVIIKTTDGGDNWTVNYITTPTEGVGSIVFTDSLNGWAVGGNGKIIHTNNGAVLRINDKSVLKKLLTLYPNPANGNFSIDLGTTYKEIIVIITNIIGQQINEYTYQHRKILNLNLEAPNGVYFITIKSNEGEATIKLVKE
ncbi:MAG: T9SS type A sorting domain-containing protein [Bacteroidetes bacterium]|nr:T9SS type A sorting domain-containing protein [Bacteroidota bacterium]